MSVCIAAACRIGPENLPAVIAASDRMITAGDVAYEPPVPKIFPLTTSIFALTAGDASATAEIIAHARQAVQRRLAADATTWIGVEEAAKMVSREVVEYRKLRAETTVFGPLGLTFDTFISRMKEMSESWARRITDHAMSFDPNTWIIVAGVDDIGFGAHIWLIDPMGVAHSHDSAGFAAIGSGERHAEAYFMFARHASWRAFPETLVLTYTAKKRAEAAPGVGWGTDMAVVGGLGGYLELPYDEIRHLQQIYAEQRKDEEDAVGRSKEKIENLFAARIKLQAEAKANASEQKAPPPSLEGPDDATSAQPPEDEERPDGAKPE